uniref:Uncharacterized protein n=1 Tax=Heterorhabditis bacteriophora TaxID=37862 RepID=A0A1I7WLS8_HETBA
MGEGSHAEGLLQLPYGMERQVISMHILCTVLIEFFDITASL